MVVILKFVSTLILFLSFLSIATGARRKNFFFIILKFSSLLTQYFMALNKMALFLFYYIGIRRLNCNSDDGCPNNYCTPPHFGKCVSKQCVCMKLAWYTKP
ncbi:Nodule Cysteine-Rich (NCR) secreted peptide [Medicago truncatula]|uniref:Nodule Cysteine-Rich (NCR) secreted peptide n=1 Tax=Medicago truncatula TaxID=3880 RepID=A0A072VHX2_MEDTR|nr:Nodule Cysteine-Rich (NCR) secreted peptide [Medicago truncatula]